MRSRGSSGSSSTQRLSAARRAAASPAPPAAGVSPGAGKPRAAVRCAGASTGSSSCPAGRARHLLLPPCRPRPPTFPGEEGGRGRRMAMPQGRAGGGGGCRPGAAEGGAAPKGGGGGSPVRDWGGGVGKQALVFRAASHRLLGLKY